jgi:hypothetical protein
MRRFLLGAVLVACCDTAELRNGLSHLWTTPIVRERLVDAGGDRSDLLASMEALVLRTFRAFQASCGLLDDDETENDAFFAAQQEAYECGQPSFLEDAGDAAETEAFETLRLAWLARVRAYLTSVASEDAAAAVLGECGSSSAGLADVDMFCWASVHEGSSRHVPHTHPRAAVSGVWYVAVPPDGAPIAFDDPRAAHSPIFEPNQRIHTPLPGELLLFPPWVIHAVRLDLT